MSFTAERDEDDLVKRVMAFALGHGPTRSATPR